MTDSQHSSYLGSGTNEIAEILGLSTVSEMRKRYSQGFRNRHKKNEEAELSEKESLPEGEKKASHKETKIKDSTANGSDKKGSKRSGVNGSSENSSCKEVDQKKVKAGERVGVDLDEGTQEELSDGGIVDIHSLKKRWETIGSEKVLSDPGKAKKTQERDKTKEEKNERGEEVCVENVSNDINVEDVEEKEDDRFDDKDVLGIIKTKDLKEKFEKDLHREEMFAKDARQAWRMGRKAASFDVETVDKGLHWKKRAMSVDDSVKMDVSGEERGRKPSQEGKRLHSRQREVVESERRRTVSAESKELETLRQKQLGTANKDVENDRKRRISTEGKELAALRKLQLESEWKGVEYERKKKVSAEKKELEALRQRKYDQEEKDIKPERKRVTSVGEKESSQRKLSDERNYALAERQRKHSSERNVVGDDDRHRKLSFERKESPVEKQFSVTPYRSVATEKKQKFSSEKEVNTVDRERKLSTEKLNITADGTRRCTAEGNTDYEGMLIGEKLKPVARKGSKEDDEIDGINNRASLLGLSGTVSKLRESLEEKTAVVPQRKPPRPEENKEKIALVKKNHLSEEKDMKAVEERFSRKNISVEEGTPETNILRTKDEFGRKQDTGVREKQNRLEDPFIDRSEDQNGERRKGVSRNIVSEPDEVGKSKGLSRMKSFDQENETQFGKNDSSETLNLSIEEVITVCEKANVLELDEPKEIDLVEVDEREERIKKLKGKRWKPVDEKYNKQKENTSSLELKGEEFDESGFVEEKMSKGNVERRKTDERKGGIEVTGGHTEAQILRERILGGRRESKDETVEVGDELTSVENCLKNERKSDKVDDSVSGDVWERRRVEKQKKASEREVKIHVDEALTESQKLREKILGEKGESKEEGNVNYEESTRQISEEENRREIEEALTEAQKLRERILGEKSENNVEVYVENEGEKRNVSEERDDRRDILEALTEAQKLRERILKEKFPDDDVEKVRVAHSDHFTTENIPFEPKTIATHETKKVIIVDQERVELKETVITEKEQQEESVWERQPAVHHDGGHKMHKENKEQTVGFLDPPEQDVPGHGFKKEMDKLDVVKDDARLRPKSPDRKARPWTIALDEFPSDDFDVLPRLV